jgi:hypothetical protein
MPSASKGCCSGGSNGYGSNGDCSNDGAGSNSCIGKKGSDAERAGMVVAAPATMVATVATAGKAGTMAGREGMAAAVTMAVTVATHFVHMITLYTGL